jgi:hypothetical protein
MSTYSPDLRIELITTGDQAGTWGATTNTNLSYVIEQAIAGYISVSVTSANQALTYINGGSATAALNQSVHAAIALTTTTGANFAVYAPPASKQYTIYNASSYTATIYNSTVIGNTTAAGTGVAIPAGKTVTVWSDGTNFAFQNNHLPSLTLTTDLAVADGGTGASSFTSGALLKGAGTSAITVASAADIVAAIGATAVTNATNATNATNVVGTIAVANGGTGATSFTSGALLKGSGTSAVAVASAADIVAQIGSTAVANATTAANGGVTSVNGSTGAVTVTSPSTDFDGVGSYAIAYYAANDPNTANSNLQAFLARGTTIAGSSLRVNSRSTSNNVNVSSEPGFQNSVPGAANNRAFPTTNTTTLSGTWRSMVGAAWCANINTDPDFTSYWYPLLWVRIA